MPHDSNVVYPQGCRPISEDLGPDELIRRLKVCSFCNLFHPSQSIATLIEFKMHVSHETMERSSLPFFSR